MTTLDVRTLDLSKARTTYNRRKLIWAILYYRLAIKTTTKSIFLDMWISDNSRFESANWVDSWTSWQRMSNNKLASIIKVSNYIDKKPDLSKIRVVHGSSIRAFHFEWKKWAHKQLNLLINYYQNAHNKKAQSQNNVPEIAKVREFFLGQPYKDYGELWYPVLCFLEII